MWFDENGIPTPYPPKPKPDPLLEMYDQQTGPPPVSNPDPTNQKFLSEAYGIGTTGPQADQAAQNATDYQAPSVDGQAMPQQFGTAEPARNEGPLTPQETAEAMPTNKASMEKMILQRLLPKPPQASGNGYANNQTAQIEAKASREQQAQLNLASAREKTGDAWQKTLALNALQGAGPWAMGGGGGGMGSPGMGSPISGGGGPQVSNIGGYRVVSGTWRPQDSNEAAKTRSTNVETDLALQKPGLEREGIQSRERIAGANLNARTASESAGQKLSADRMSETSRHNKAMETNATADDERKRKEVLEKKYKEEFTDLEETLAQLQERDFFGEDAFKAQMPGTLNKMIGWSDYTSDKSPFLDTDYTELDKTDPDSKKWKKGVMKPGSYERGARNAAKLFEQLEAAKAAGLHGNQLRPELVKYLEQLKAKYPNQ